MHADDRLLETGADFRNGEGRSVGCVDAVRILDNFVLHMLEQLLLQIHVFKNGFNDKVRIFGNFIFACLNLGENTAGFFLLHLALGNTV